MWSTRVTAAATTARSLSRTAKAGRRRVAEGRTGRFISAGGGNTSTTISAVFAPAIETAPTNADILIATSEGYVGQGNFRDYMPGEDDAWWWAHEEIIDNPTHWMPLPSSPEIPKAERQETRR